MKHQGLWLRDQIPYVGPRKEIVAEKGGVNSGKEEEKKERKEIGSSLHDDPRALGSGGRARSENLALSFSPL